MNPIGVRLRKLRLSRGLTQEALAAKLEVSQGHIANLENREKTMPSLKLLHKLAAELGVEPAYFLADEPVEEPEHA